MPALTTEAPAQRNEVLLAVILGVVAAAAVFGYHVLEGGRYLDDWWLSAGSQFPEEHGFSNSWQVWSYYSGWRPGAAGFWWITHGVLGTHDELHRALSAVLAGVATGTFFALLRALRLSRLAAAAVALLALLSPLGDSVHMWITPGVSQLALALCFIGFTLALRQLAREQPRSLLAHVPSLLLFAASLSVAEITAPLMLCSLLLYRARAGWRTAARLWAADAALALAILGYYVAARPHGGARTLDETASHGVDIAGQALSLVLESLVPFATSKTLVLIGVGLVVAVVGLRTARLDLDDPRRQRVTTALTVALAAAIITLATYLPYAPSEYSPGSVGIDNRVNVVAVFPIAVLLGAIVAAVAAAVDGDGRRRGWPVAIAATMLLYIGAGSAVRLGHDERHWVAAADVQDRVLTALHEIAPNVAHGTTLFVYGTPGVATRITNVGFEKRTVSVPVFSTWWEMQSAVRVAYGDGTLHAYPVWAYQPPQISCGVRNVYFLGLDGAKRSADYGRVIFIDLFAHGSLRIDSRLQCQAESSRRTVRFDLPV
jgi:hypothetical protein